MKIALNAGRAGCYARLTTLLANGLAAVLAFNTKWADYPVIFEQAAAYSFLNFLSNSLLKEI